MNISELRSAFAEQEQRFIKEWKTFLGFPSISADPLYNKNCRECAAWLANHLDTIGLSSEIWETSGKPVIFAERNGAPEKPTILFYGHYDVQPIDPEEAWKTPPFTPTLRNGRIYARGAQDNKGQMFYTLKAIETLINNSALDATIKVIIEGEEEYGSAGITEEMLGWADRLQADIMMVHDTSTIRSGNPTITMGLRGIVHLSIELEGPDHDLHSGAHGGLAPNPAQGIAHLVDSMFGDDGKVSIEGFYDGVLTPSKHELELALQSPFDIDEYKALVGTTPDGGMVDASPQERVGFLPSLDVNGIHTGYGGAGMKTVLPSKAIAKLSARIVPNQDPAAVLECLISHIYRHAPKGMRLTISDQGVGGPGFRLSPQSPLAAKARTSLEMLNQGSVVFHWEGASIPIISGLAAVSGAEPLLVGFGHEDDHIHAPNESFSIDQFRNGYLYTALFLQGV